MTFRMGLLGKKIGMLHQFDSREDMVPYTVIVAGPCVVVDLLTEQRNGYSAIKLGFDEQKPHRLTQGRIGVFAAAKSRPMRFVREIRLSEEELKQFKVGALIRVEEVFKQGDIVDVTGISKGKGFQGVMKRHGFSGFHATHGTHESFRHGGSIGCRLTPGRVVKGRKMSGQMGDHRVTIQNQSVGRVIPEKNAILIRGSLPGRPGGYVIARHAVKSALEPFSLLAGHPEEKGAAEATA